MTGRANSNFYFFVPGVDSWDAGQFRAACGCGRSVLMVRCFAQVAAVAGVAGVLTGKQRKRAAGGVVGCAQSVAGGRLVLNVHILKEVRNRQVVPDQGPPVSSKTTTTTTTGLSEWRHENQM